MSPVDPAMPDGDNNCGRLSQIVTRPQKVPWRGQASTRARAKIVLVGGMTRGCDENHLAIYPAATNEAHRHDTETGIHWMRRGTKHAAAYERLATARQQTVVRERGRWVDHRYALEL
jgi:hypothetical protein